MNPFGIFLIVATVTVPVCQLFALPNVSDQVALFSQYLGLAALILMAWGQILSTRLPGIESLFGGLDRVYVLHKWTGITAMAAVLLHDTIDAEMRGLGRETILNEIAETLGEFSLYGLLILVVISVATFIPYQLWKWTHKAIGALFAAGTFHFFFIMKPFAMGDPAGLYTGAFCTAGLLAYFWMLLPDRMRPSKAYSIASLERSGGALAITMAPVGKALRASPGQFGVLQFPDSGNSEPHPFSFSKIGDDATLRVTVKALGDFTSRMGSTLTVGQNVRIQGPFGRFRYSGKRPEIWIAGGIGITPFLAWAHALDDHTESVDLFYCAKSREDASHLAELESLVKSKPNLNLHLMLSSENRRLSADIVSELSACDLAQAMVSYCGPTSLREAMYTGLRQYGVGPRQFHFEEFEFRTGVGLKRLAAWVLTHGKQSRKTISENAKG
ncbi:ferric reductase-like transmembrane domain-containing protein [Epibacterium ulvae]|uniref:ferredoxin reductase family protein n=1 Tax=Epibacterium ulvae TaxID=1156985 RepID=UPI001BFBF9D3|nr:ferric reductase-like transmembrane domain-containing protein [Epibacterium ulvae]MBT8155656.1 ferric reductase-like transmembrane domain-containing protein [Epibacterium ulvae]